MDTDDTESWTVAWDEHHEAPYMHKGVKWVSYDNEESIKVKSDFAYKHNLAGVMVWSIDTDDFRGKCGGPTFPLLRTINHALYLQEQGLASAGRPTASFLVLMAVTAILRQILWFTPPLPWEELLP